MIENLEEPVPVILEKEVPSKQILREDKTLGDTAGIGNSKDSQSSYNGDYVDNDGPPDGEYKAFQFPNPFLVVAFYDQEIADGLVTLHPWQLEVNQDLAIGRNIKTSECNKPTSQSPYKYCLLAANGSGKDKFIIAPFAIWFTLTKIRSRVIITTASGVQLSSQTEPYIKDLCEKVNAFHGQEIYRIRQRYIKCMLTGSEIRMFATDESGKAEGYHPIDANSEMAIIVNEGKSVTEDIHRALRRCTGFNYWLEISSAGEPKGYLYTAYTRWPNIRRITSFECPHVSKDEIQEDVDLDGEHSAFFRSKHLSLFTSIGGQVVIPMELVNDCIANPPKTAYASMPIRIGIDLAAGGDENAICITQGNKVIKEYAFRETDTVIAANRISSILNSEKISKDYDYIFADDGGVGRSIIDMLVTNLGWKINRVMNQWAALGNKKQFSNRGAENWWRIRRIIEERTFDLRGLSDRTIEQLYNRHFKQSLAGGKILLEDKREAKSHGRPSPDRADAFILSLTGVTLEDFNKETKTVTKEDKPDTRPKIQLHSRDEVYEHYENEETYLSYNKKPKSGRIYNSLRKILC